MSREEAAALAVAQVETGDDGVTVAEDIDRTFARTVLAAADAHDAAHGIHRVSLDDATVERAAQGSWDALAEREGGRPWSKIGALNQARWAGNVKAVLAAAVEADDL